MPADPTAPLGARLFARIDRFHVECPFCMTLIVADLDSRRPRREWGVRSTVRRQRRERGRPHPRHAYNPYLQQLRCPCCKHVYFVGLLLWSPPAYDRSRRLPPLDAVPTPRQRAELRQLSLSIWPTQRKRAGEAVNVYVTGECSCTSLGVIDAHCPVHGQPELKPLDD